MGRPAKFSREQLQAAALALVDEHGLAGLSMRALANALGTGAMTLYNYVTEREDLDILVVEAVIAEARWSPGRNRDWREDVRLISTALWKAVRAHPHAIPLILTRRSRSPAVFGVSEALLDALSRGGKSGQELLVAFRSVSALVMGFAQAELAGPLAVKAGETANATIARFRALPAERYRCLIEIATAAESSAPEAEFRAALDLLLKGMSAGGD
ncbi:MAG TPA: TetR/AcrR family transcriptional regulator C-terminal domain-containing protein [Noviherbaspirillum sp.]|nr:TetR/AcrR family transcriptional regulator C-terminal domain-containing protein [Noviherbaspirillum sp.]